MESEIFTLMCTPLAPNPTQRAGANRQYFAMSKTANHPKFTICALHINTY